MRLALPCAGRRGRGPARLGVALLVLTVVAAARADSTVEARAHYRHGVALFNEGRFADARAEFEAGYELQPLPLFLFNAAQAARRADQNTRALELYKKFVSVDPQSSQRAEAEQHIAELEPRAAEPPRAAPADAPAAAPAGAAIVGTAVARAVVAAPPLVVAPARRRWSRDAAGGTLVGLGVAAAAAGAVLVGIGGARIADAQRSYDNFDAATRAGPLVTAGGVTLGVAAALLVAGAIRYGVAARRRAY